MLYRNYIKNRMLCQLRQNKNPRGEIYLVLFVSKKYTLVSRGKKTTFLRKKTRAAKAARFFFISL